MYAKPDDFDPSRFLGREPALEPSKYVFGFGRRVCPGRQLAESSVWLTIARSLAVFNMSKAVDGTTGRVIEPDLRFSPGVISHPAPFQAQIVPRSLLHGELIRAVRVLHPWEKRDASMLG